MGVVYGSRYAMSARPDYRAVRAMRLEPAIRATPSNHTRTRLKLKVARPTVKSRIKWIRSKYEKFLAPVGSPV